MDSIYSLKRIIYLDWVSNVLFHHWNSGVGDWATLLMLVDDSLRSYGLIGCGDDVDFLDHFLLASHQLRHAIFENVVQSGSCQDKRKHHPTDEDCQIVREPIFVALLDILNFSVPASHRNFDRIIQNSEDFSEFCIADCHFISNVNGSFNADKQLLCSIRFDDFSQ